MTRIEPKNMNLTIFFSQGTLYVFKSTNHLESETNPSTISGTVEDFHVTSNPTKLQGECVIKGPSPC